MRYRLRSIDVLSLAKLLGCIYGAIGVVVAFFGLVIYFTLAAIGAEQQASHAGLGLLVMTPFLYAIVGFLSGILCAWIYNLFANKVGPVEVQLEPAPGTPVTSAPVI